MLYLISANILLYFGTNEDNGPLLQILATGLLIIGAIRSVQTRPLLVLNLSELYSIRLIIIGVVMPIVAIVSAVIDYNWTSALYSCIFLTSIFSVYAYTITYSPDELKRAVLISLLIVGFITISTESDMLIDALQRTQTERGLSRFSPFGNHPNLTGHIFGIGAILTFSLTMSSKPLRIRTANLAFTVFFLVFVIASGSRGALAAFLVAGFVLVTANQIRRITYDGASPALLLMTAVFITIGAPFVIEYTWNFWVQVLDLQSEYRGVDSGGSGRVDNWIDFIAYFISSPKAFLIGNGLRSWSVEQMGYDSDNSYINMLNELGFVLTVLIIGLVFSRVHQLWKLAKTSTGALTYLGIAIFIIVDSIFARYMLSIGNTSSYLVLIVIVGPLSQVTVSVNKISPANASVAV